MIAVVTLLLALPLGLLCRTRVAANTTYAVAYLWAFVFQTLYLLLDSLSGRSEMPAFEPGDFPLSYGVMTLLVLGVGFALVEGGHRWGERRRASQGVSTPAMG